jgi:ABC-type sugar transport system ATPase subunit
VSGESVGEQIRVSKICKSFGETLALDGVSITVGAGEIHALVGENGAGKSTLGKVISGVVQPDSGAILIEGRETRFRSPRGALAAGIALVHQEVSLVPGMTVIENVMLGVESSALGVVRPAEMRKRFAELNAEKVFGLDPDKRVGSLALAAQQKVEVARSLVRGARVVIFDEPTAALNDAETEQVYELMRSLRDRDPTIILVSHFLKDVLRLADTVSILKDARLVRSGPAASETVDSLVVGMLGRTLDAAFPPKRPARPRTDAVLQVEGLTRSGAVEDVTFSIGTGEIVGVAGLMGSGRTQLARLIFGADRADSGRISIEGRQVSIRSPWSAMRAGIAYIPESRRDDGIIPSRSVRANVSIASLPAFSSAGVMRKRAERSAVDGILKDVDLRPWIPDNPISTLSGGNQQKAVIARWLLREPHVLLADEPTRGVDVGAKRAIYDLLHSAAESGMGVLLISSELEEVLELAERILVIRAGRLVAEFGGDVDEADVLAAAFGEGKADGD